MQRTRRDIIKSAAVAGAGAAAASTAAPPSLRPKSDVAVLVKESTRAAIPVVRSHPASASAPTASRIGPADSFSFIVPAIPITVAMNLPPHTTGKKGAANSGEAVAKWSGESA